MKEMKKRGRERERERKKESQKTVVYSRQNTILMLKICELRKIFAQSDNKGFFTFRSLTQYEKDAKPYYYYKLRYFII